ncbi:MAG: ABC transporter permease, partial [Acidimicrobiales bacterium]|nr:ABC transporter permease [Acidimicrobiales bacterium]
MGFIRSYAGHELRRRKGRAIVTALGLASGVALVLSIIGTSAGLADAQKRALTPLSSVGTDILVTRGNNDDTQTTATAGPPNASAGGPQVVRRGFGDTADQEETNALKTDLSKLGNPGDTFTHDFFVASGGLTFDDDVLSELRKVAGVDDVVAGLTMVATHQTGTVPAIVAEVNQPEQTVRPEPPTADERQATEDCLKAKGVNIGEERGGDVTVEGPTPGSGGQGGPPRGGFAAVGGDEFLDCMPARFKALTIPQRTLTQALNPPQTDIESTTYTAGGVDPANPGSGLVSDKQVTKGRYIAADATDEAMVASSYAKTNKLGVGSTLTINDKPFTVVGLVEPAVEGSAADVYFPLTALQELSNRAGRINTVLVTAKSADDVEAVAAAIRKQLGDEAQVVTTASLASQVTGSLKDTKKLADRFGGVLAVLVLASAFSLAALLTLGSIGKRVREIGTLRAVGWSRRMVVRQILVETLGISVIGAVLGIGLGLGAGVAIGKFSPT